MSFASTSELPSSKSRNKLSLLDFTTLAPNNSILAKPYDCTSRRLYNFFTQEREREVKEEEGVFLDLKRTTNNHLHKK
eukprot:m.112273 g.112273  ORF g.112273 m.112273 type:complete len:78 (+) comp9251_c0_seq1:1543-1776(+)